MLVTSKDFLYEAKKHKYAVPAPDFIDSDSARVFVEAAEYAQKPLILSFAEAHGDILSLEEAANIGIFYAKKVSVPVALHFDHGMSEESVRKAIDLGFTSVMIDASMKSFDENVDVTRKVVSYAHSKGIFVEAEIGHVGSGVNYESHKMMDSVYTEVPDAVQFVEKTGVDFLAVSIGTAHGLYKGTPKIDFDRLKLLAEALPQPLVLHGGSSSGDGNLQRCAQEGISKINIFTDFMTAAVNRIQRDGIKDYFSLKKSACAAMREVLLHYYNIFMPK